VCGAPLSSITRAWTCATWTATAASDGAPEILERVAPLARRLALSREWLEAAHHVCDAEQGFGIHVLHERRTIGSSCSPRRAFRAVPRAA
jgi:hypothetical protein